MAEKSQNSNESSSLSLKESGNGNGFKADNRKTEQGGSQSTFGKDYIGEVPDHMPKAEIAKDRLRFWVSLIVFLVILYFIIRGIILLVS
ncbi:hypothetical protein COV13_04345 [Candidatus Woesearchaeota archaeon CG10_big_fil_rev_8_21_14_0_10_32_9]|nr:MAG: hypothetical protein COV13_04345 [Candidatus Woesearchaeota archaeon CG10_big_fil_rev_8_21_14_0_10_32_9]